MKNKPPNLVEHVARTICKSASKSHSEFCPHCEVDNRPCMWECFVIEAEDAIDAVSDFCTLSLRTKPKRK